VPTGEVAGLIGWQLFFVTIVLRPTDDIWSVTDIFQRAKRTLRYRFLYKLAKRDARYDGIFAMGALEVGLVPDNQIGLLGPQKRNTLIVFQHRSGTPPGARSKCLKFRAKSSVGRGRDRRRSRPRLRGNFASFSGT
jgi:hypothetical protein